MKSESFIIGKDASLELSIGTIQAKHAPASTHRLRQVAQGLIGE